MLCAVGLERAGWLAASGLIPATGSERWRAEAAAIRTFVERHCRTATGGRYTMRILGRQTVLGRHFLPVDALEDENLFRHVRMDDLRDEQL